MKKFFCTVLCAAMLLSALTLTACGEAEALRIGLGVYTVTQTGDAVGDKDGSAQATITVAAVLVDEKGKIVKCFLDCADHTVKYTAEGKALANESFQTKYEQGDAYGMKAWGGAAKEWYEQADAFSSLVVGKTVDEVKALVASDHKGTADVIRAGCTIEVSAFALAIEKAVKDAAPSSAAANDTLKLGVFTEQTTVDATEDKPGQNQLETTLFAASVDKEGKITASRSDCVQIDFTFDANGASLFDAATGITSKREAGDAYGMKAWGGAAKEWYEQANTFDAACIGKRAGELFGLLGADGYGIADLQRAGCTIDVSAFVEAASKTG